MKACDEKLEMEQVKKATHEAVIAEEGATIQSKEVLEAIGTAVIGATSSIEREKVAGLMEEEAKLADEAARIAGKEAEVLAELAASSAEPEKTSIDYFVELDGVKKRGVLDHSPATGREIRAGCGIPDSDDLARLVHGRPTGGNICLDESVPVHCGEGFIAVPSGRVS